MYALDNLKQIIAEINNFIDNKNKVNLTLSIDKIYFIEIYTEE